MSISSPHLPALLIVDVQVGNTTAAHDSARIIANIGVAVAKARAGGVPMIYVQHEGEDMPRDSAEWQLRPELPGPIVGDLRIYKRYESSFEETPLAHHLARLGVTHLVLCGAATNWCVRAAAYGALERGFDVTLLSDGHTTGDIRFEDGVMIPATHVIRELNLVMTWITYPGRHATTVTAEGLDLGRAPGGART